MSQNNQIPLIYSTQINIPLEIRAYLITRLNQMLARTVDLRSQVKHAAWNVNGTTFVQARAVLDALAIDLEAHTDLVAERIADL